MVIILVITLGHICIGRICPKIFKKNIDKYIAHKSIVFEGIDYFAIWALLMVKAHGTLASYVVNIGDTYSSKEEIVALLKERVKKIE